MRLELLITQIQQRKFSPGTEIRMGAYAYNTLQLLLTHRTSNQLDWQGFYASGLTHSLPKELSGQAPMPTYRLITDKQMQPAGGIIIQ